MEWIVLFILTQLPPEDTWGCSEIVTRIRYQGTSADTPSSGHVDVPLQRDSLVQSYTVTGLVPCSGYEIVLMLSNSGGYFGPMSSMTSVDVGGDGKSDRFLLYQDYFVTTFVCILHFHNISSGIFLRHIVWWSFFLFHG